MARKRGRILPFRIPFFRIFYSTTYTILFLLCLAILAITPTSLIWTAIQNQAFQYIIMIGGVYILTALFAIFVYSSRLYTNRIVLAGVGKAYIPIEEGEIGKSVRRMIVKQLERSAIVAWESRPRDLAGEILQAEQYSFSAGNVDHALGKIITVDPKNPPWGRVQHAGWSPPSHSDDNNNPEIQFQNVLAELPNLLEARAVSFALPGPTVSHAEDHSVADPEIVDVLHRPENMGMRDYLTQLSSLGLINPPEIGQTFVRMYEKARFSGRPATEREFGKLMAMFSELLAGMTDLNPAVVEQIRMRAKDTPSATDGANFAPAQLESPIRIREPSRSVDSRTLSPVTAYTAPSRTVTPYLQQNSPSLSSFSSVIHNMPGEPSNPMDQPMASSETLSSQVSSPLESIPSDAGSVLRYTVSSNV